MLYLIIVGLGGSVGILLWPAVVVHAIIRAATPHNPAGRLTGLERPEDVVEPDLEAIKAVKADTQALKLQKEFFEKTTHALDTKQ
ncbi:MAG TPA: hypothetical protein VF783_01520 [Terriglobales bacterium]